MSTTHFRPWGQPQPCWHCQRFERLLLDGSAALCRLAHGPRVRSLPANGCSAFVREPGADDEPGPPPSNCAMPPPTWGHPDARHRLDP